MSIGSELLRVLINIAIVLIVGAMAYEFVFWIIRNIIIPIREFNKHMNKVPALLTDFAKIYSNSIKVQRKELTRISHDLKMLSSKIIADRESIPFFDLIGKVNLLTHRSEVDEILRSMNYLANAIFDLNPSISTINMVQDKIILIEECLGIEKQSSRRIKRSEEKPEEVTENPVSQ